LSAGVEENAVFRALADPSRRLLLDRLFVRDGRSIVDLGGDLEMTRFGVAKHLRILETAGLVSTRRAGREKLHYLNPVPIQQIHERWVSKYSAPWARALSGLKTELEAEMKPRHVYHVFIRTTPERLWQALTDGDMTSRYFHSSRAESAWTTGSPYAFRSLEGAVEIEGTVLDIEPPRRLVQTFRFASRDDVPSKVTWEIEQLGESCRLTLIHEFDREDGTFDDVNDPMGWQFILSGLKTLLETDRPLVVSHE
jgi:uncharacterized protein YndB with AHSA1/START domain/DNA-binding MarR family transcriptional regulator